MSGGVDSSVTAALMKEAGYETIGVTMCFSIPQTGSKKPSCCGAEGIEDARRAAQILDIPHYTMDFAADINKQVIDDFVGEYLNGRTPNPCVRCNQYLKFGTLYEKVMSMGADYLATGHYARICYNPKSASYEMKRAFDATKDQSYFLYSINKEALSKILFPLGGMTKNRVRDLARKYNLNTAQKAESQDICFVPDGDYKNFIKSRLGKAVFQKGDFRDAENNIIGEHAGIAHYTIGQRERLGLALGHPVYVYRIEKETRTVYVGSRECLYSEGLSGSQFNSLDRNILDGPLEVNLRIRYNSKEVRGQLTCLKDNRIRVDFDEPQKAVTPGQSIVFYRDDVVLGGAVIDSSMNRRIDPEQSRRVDKPNVHERNKVLWTSS